MFFSPSLDLKKPMEFTSRIGARINLYPEILLLLKRGYLQLEGHNITIEDADGKHNLFKLRKKGHTLEMLDTHKNGHPTYTTYYPRIHNREKLFMKIREGAEEKAAVTEDETLKSRSFIFLSNQYPAVKNGHTNITIMTHEGDHEDTSEINFSKKNPSHFKYAETLIIPTEGVIAGMVYSGHEGGTGITQAMGFSYPDKIVAEHMKMDAFIDSLTQKTPEMKYQYSAFSAPVYHGFNCTRYALHALSAVGIKLDDMMGVNRLTFSPGQLGDKIKHFFDHNKTEPDFEVYVKNADGSDVNKKPISFFKCKPDSSGKQMIYVDGGDSKDKFIKLDDGHVLNPNLTYILRKIYNGEAVREGNVYTITADKERDMKYAVPRVSDHPIKPSFKLEIDDLKIDSGSVIQKAAPIKHREF